MTKKIVALMLFAICCLALVACKQTDGQTSTTTKAKQTAVSSSEQQKQTTSEEVTVQVSAAASLTDVTQKLAEKFAQVHPELKLNFNYGSSGKLQQQIEQGAPVDLFISAGKKQVKALSEAGLTDTQSEVDLLANEVVLIAPKDSDLAISDFKEVASDKVKMVALGESSVPVGQYSETIFTNLGVWDEVKAKANFGTDVRAVLAWVEQKAVDCGVVYATDAAVSDQVKVLATAPKDSHDPVIYPATIIKNSANPEQAKTFLDYLQSEEAQQIFAEFGFSRPESKS